jgi:hypothetical protein
MALPEPPALKAPPVQVRQAQPGRKALLVHWERLVLPALALTEPLVLRAQPVLRALRVQAQLAPLVPKGRQVLLAHPAHPAQSGLLVQAPLELRELALQALQAFKEQRVRVLTVPQVRRASQELQEPLALLVPQVLAKLAL